MLTVTGFKRQCYLCEARFRIQGEKQGYLVFLLTCANKNHIPPIDNFGEYVFLKSKEDVACSIIIWNDIEFVLCQTIWMKSLEILFIS